MMMMEAWLFFLFIFRNILLLDCYCYYIVIIVLTKKITDNNRRRPVEELWWLMHRAPRQHASTPAPCMMILVCGSSIFMYDIINIIKKFDFCCGARMYIYLYYECISLYIVLSLLRHLPGLAACWDTFFYASSMYASYLIIINQVVRSAKKIEIYLIY